MSVTANVPNLKGTKRLSDLLDVNDYSNYAGKILKINAKGDGTEWATLDAFQNFDEVKLQLDELKSTIPEIQEKFETIKNELSSSVDSSTAIMNLKKEDENIYDRLKEMNMNFDAELTGSAEALRDVSKYVDKVRDNTDKAMKLSGENALSIVSLQNSGATLQGDFDKLVETVSANLIASKQYTDQEVAKAVDMIKAQLSGMVMSDSEIMTKIIKLIENDKSMEDRVTAIETDYLKRDIDNKKALVDLKTIDLQHDTRLTGIDDLIRTLPSKADVKQSIQLATADIATAVDSLKVDTQTHAVKIKAVEERAERQQQTIGDQGALIGLSRDEIATIKKEQQVQDESIAALKVKVDEVNAVKPIEVFAVNKTGSVPAPTQADIQRFLCADGKWKDVKAGAQTADYCCAILQAGHGFPANYTIHQQWNQSTQVGETRFVNGSGFFLKANKTYELECSMDVSFNDTAMGKMSYQWFNITTGTWIDGSIGMLISTAANQTFSGQPIAKSIISVKSDCWVAPRTISVVGGHNTIQAIDGGSGYVVIKQLGSSEIITETVFSAETEIKNFVTKDTNSKYNPHKMLNDWFWSTHSSNLDKSEVALKIGDNSWLQYTRFAFLMQKLIATIGGCNNDYSYDTFHQVLKYSQGAGTQDKGAINKNISFGESTDVDAQATNVYNEFFKLVLGRSDTHLYWVSVVPVYSDANATSICTGFNYEGNNGQWTIWGDDAIPPMIRSAPNLTLGGSPSLGDATISRSRPAIQYMPHRLELY